MSIINELKEKYSDFQIRKQTVQDVLDEIKDNVSLRRFLFIPLVTGGLRCYGKVCKDLYTPCFELQVSKNYGLLTLHGPDPSQVRCSVSLETYGSRKENVINCQTSISTLLTRVAELLLEFIVKYNINDFDKSGLTDVFAEKIWDESL